MANENGHLTFFKTAHSLTAVFISRSVSLSKDGSDWKAFCCGHPIPVESEVLASVSDKLDSKGLEALLHLLEEGELCCGNSDQKFVSFLKSKGEKSFSADGETVVAFIDAGSDGTPTVRTTSCSILVKHGRCDCCSQYRDTLRTSFNRWKARNASGTSSSSSDRTNLRYLDHRQIAQRYKNLRSRLHTAESKVRLLLEKQTEEKGISLDKETHDDLEQIMKGMTTEVRSQWEEGSFRRIFWEQQLEALKVKDSRQIRWLPAMIRWCLHLRFKSSGAYRSLRESGAVVLPSERTLIDYTHWCKRGAGFIPDVDELLLKEIGDLGEERRKYVVLCFDEMKIKENLVFDKHSFSLVGFYNMGDVSNAISEVESQSAGK